MAAARADEVIELNVGGVPYATSLATLMKYPDSLLAKLFSPGGGEGGAPPVAGEDRLPALRDREGRHLIDRDGPLFRFLLDFMRNDRVLLPDRFPELRRLRSEAEFFRLTEMAALLAREVACPEAERLPGSITVGYRGSFAFGSAGMSDVKFRKLARILVCGRVALCREIFGETLNDSRNPDLHDEDRYSSRFFLKHVFLEQAFDMLLRAGFSCMGACGSGTAGLTGECKPGVESEETRWNHYNEYLFVRK